MSVLAQIPLLPPLTVETLLDGDSIAPSGWPLTAFCTWALQKPKLSEAPVRQVLCNRQGVHEFILLSCDIQVAAQDIVTLWLRIERRPSSQGVGVLLNKPKPAMDTVKASTNLQALREPCDSRDSFMYNPHDKPREVLKLKHIAEMCRYFTGHSIEYSLLGANCRWICYALLECLRESQPCYGGTWLPSRNERPTADVRAAQLAKSHYLQDKHPTCCGRQYLVCPNLGAQITRATVGLASIAVTGSSQNTRNRGSQYADQGVIYRTPRSLPESAVPRQGTSVLTTNANANAGRNFSTATSPQPVSLNGTSSNNTTSSNTPELSLRAGAAQSNRHQDNVSPLPAGANITQYSEALSESTYENTPSDSQTQRHTTTPHIQHNVSQLGGTFSTPHCSGCQCTGHSGQHQNVSNDRRPDPARSKPPLIDSRGDGIHDLTSQFSSMSVQSSVSVRGTSHGQRVGGDACAAREPIKVPTIHQCSGCGSQGGTHTQTLTFPVAQASNATCNSFDMACAAHPGRIHPKSSQQCVPSLSSTGSTQRNNTRPMSSQHPIYRGHCEQHTNPCTSLPLTSALRTQRVTDGSNFFNAGAPRQHLSQFSFSGTVPSMTEVSPGCTMHQNRALYSGTDWLGSDNQALAYMEGCLHTHNHPPERFPGPSCSMPQDCSFPDVNSLPQPYQVHEIPSIPPTPQGSGGNPQKYSTGDSYLKSESHTYGPSTSLPRTSVNRNSLYQSQALHGHMHAPPSPMRHNGNLHSEFRHPITQPNPYSIPEPQIGFGNRWDLASGMSANLSCGHGIQSMLSDYTQPPPSTNPPVNATSDYTHPQHFETTLQQRYVSSELPADPYSQLDPPNRQWTQEVWGNQEFSLPLRTDSPKPLESPLTDRASSESQETVMFTSMPNHHDYVRPQGFNCA